MLFAKTYTVILILLMMALPVSAEQQRVSQAMAKSAIDLEKSPSAVVARLLPFNNVIETSPVVEQQKFYKLLAFAYYLQEQFDESLRYVRLGIGADNGKNEKSLGQLYFLSLEIANLQSLGDFKLAREKTSVYLRQALASNAVVAEADALLLTMNFDIRDGRWQEGLAAAKRAQEIVWDEDVFFPDATTRAAGRAKIIWQIARAFEQINPLLAIESYEHALKIARSYNLSGNRIYFNLRRLLYLSVLIDSKEKIALYLPQVEQVGERPGKVARPLLLALACSNQALLTKELTLANKCMLEAKTQLHTEFDANISALYHLQFVRLALAENRYSDALAHLNSQKTLFSQQDSRWSYLTYQELLATSYEHLGDFDKASEISAQRYAVLSELDDKHQFVKLVKLLAVQNDLEDAVTIDKQVPSSPDPLPISKNLLGFWVLLLVAGFSLLLFRAISSLKR